MNLVLKIAAGIVLGGVILSLIGMLFSVGLVAGFTHYVSKVIEHAAPTPHFSIHPLAASAPGSVKGSDSPAHQDEQRNAEAARERAQKARCMVRTADGREFYCDSLGPFTPR